MSQRVAQIEAAVTRILASLIAELSDPRLPLILSVEKVRITSDLIHARVFISCIGDVEQAVAALNHAKGFLQRGLTREIQLKRTPLLEFYAASEDPMGLL